MARHHSQAARPTDPGQVWAALETDHQRRALQLLAQMALNFLTAHATPTQKEDSVCSNSVRIPSYAPITSSGRR
jgi:hypothetical protein